jgi:ribosomal protein S18 acetylase RimI-like enzyme
LLNDVRIVEPAGLTSAEIALAQQLIDTCNRAESLDLPMDVTAESAAGETRYVVAWVGDRLAGVASIFGRQELEVCLAVAPKDRRRGIGRALLASARDAVAHEGKSEYLLVADEASVAGRAFVAAMGGRYRESEYRMILNERAVPAGRDWPTPVQVRQGSSDDVDLMARLLAESFGDSEAEAKEWVTRILPQPNHRFFIGSVDGEPIGILRTNYYGTDIYVTSFRVVSEQRGRGFGRQMLLHTVDRLVAEKWPRILIEVATDNPNALGLYKSCGFQVTTTYGFYEQTV